MPRATFETWLKATYAIDYRPGNPANSEDAALVVGVQNAYAKDWLENRLETKIRQTLAGIVGHSVKVEFLVRPRSRVEDGNVRLLDGMSDHEPTGSATEPGDHKSRHRNGKSKSYTHLNPRYTFDRFIVGTGNRLAHAAALAIAEHVAERPYNPLFIYGGVGLGKTHLLHAAGHLPAARGLKVLVVSSEQFTNDLIAAIRTQTTNAFREKYRDVDVLLIDDIQFIAGKERIQEELFHTFNTLHSANKQIVLTSDRHPKGLTTLEERLRSRFEWGLTADIQPPDVETRIAILQSKAERHPVPIPLEVLEIIAHQIQSNIRELEGALNRVVMYARCMNLPITVETATRALADLLAAKPEPPSVPVILEIVAGFHDLAVDDLLGRSRSRRIALPRQIAMYILREEAGLSFPQIGAEMGGRDHSTVMHAHRKINDLIAEDDSLRRTIMVIKQRMYQRGDDQGQRHLH